MAEFGSGEPQPGPEALSAACFHLYDHDKCESGSASIVHRYFYGEKEDEQLQERVPLCEAIN